MMRLRGLLIAFAASLVVVTVWSSPVLAAGGKHVFNGSFGGEGVGAGQLINPSGVAINESTRDVYIVDQGNDRIEQFSSNGAYISQFDGAASPAGAFESPEGIAVDNSKNPLDPSAGDVYVTDTGHKVIDKFTSSGTYLGQLTEAEGSTFSGLFGVAVDQNGIVWVYQENGEIDSFSDAELNGFLSSRSSPYGAASGFAVDSDDDLYVNRGSKLLAELTSAGEPLIEEVDAEETTAAAVDMSTNYVYVDNVDTVGVFGPTGRLVERFGSGYLTSGNGIAVDAENGDVYVADSAADKVALFTPEPPGKAEITAVSAANVTDESADLSARIDPVGLATTYYFRYGTADCTTSPASCAEMPAPPSAIGASFGQERVGVQLENLLPGAIYHYSVVAANALGTTESAEPTFTTQPRPGAFVLPDGRAWEMVSPSAKGAATIEAITAEGGVIQASEDGDAITYVANAPLGEPEGNPARGLTQVLATRRPEGWASQDIATPHNAVTGVVPGEPAEYRFFSPDLSLGLVEQTGNDKTPLSPPVLPGEAQEKTVYVRDASTGSYSPLVTAADVPPGAVYGRQLVFTDATPDLSHIVLESDVALTELPIAEKDSLYEWAGGKLQLISVLPGTGEVAASSPALGADDSDVRHAISNDGSRIFWSAEGHLYMRDMPKKETIQLDADQGGPPAYREPHEAQFQLASSEGSSVFFADAERLTAHSTARPEFPAAADLYECELIDVAGKETCHLNDLTEDHNAGESAEVQGVLPGASEDGSYVYFVAKGALTSVKNGEGEKAKPGVDNLYVRHNNGMGWEEPRFIAGLSSEDAPDWTAGSGSGLDLATVTSRVSPDGGYLAFMSDRSLTGYDNTDVNEEAGVHADEEVYLYDAETDQLVCASCDPTGARPTGVYDPGASAGLLVDQPGTWEGHWLAGSVPGWTSEDLTHALYQSRYLSNSGRLFFDSPDALVSQDTNGVEDVYEYEPVGVGDCTDGTSSGSNTHVPIEHGCVGLISSGTSSEESAFLDASESGDDLFFLTAARLVTQDVDDSFDVYDAHVCGAEGVACVAPGPSLPSPCTTANSCRTVTPPQTGALGSPASATFAGPGNLLQTVSKSALKSKPLTRAQKLAIALRNCRKRYRQARKRRTSCEAQARKKDGPVKKKASKPAKARR